MLTDSTDCQYRAQVPLHKSSIAWLMAQSISLISSFYCCFNICRMNIAILPSSLDMDIQKGNECIVHVSVPGP